jgi:hypothetical protein
MKSNNDKIFLILSLVLLVGSVAFYIVGSGAGTGKDLPQVQATGSDYAAIPLPQVDGAEITWPDASEQSTGWVYDLFTPPKIFINLDTGEWVSEGWTPAPKIPFGLYLAELDRALYRIQLLGYIEEDFKDATKSLLLVVDKETDNNLRVRVGQAVLNADFEVIDFQIKRVFGDDGSITKLATASILDTRTGKEVILTHGKELYTDGVSILLESNEDRSIAWRPKAIGDSLETDLGNYSLAAMNLEAATVTIGKEFLDGEYDPITETLSVAVASVESDTTESDANDDDTEDENPFDGMF